MGAVMPLGFFENTKEIYAEIASYPVVPPEKIRQYWNVYTTTFRRLFDPSAFRLENFWWHVWGSDRLRNLSGPELARLFEEFSNGPTFVPLPSPADRFRRLKTPGSSRHGTEGHVNHPTPPLRDTPEQGSASSIGKKGLTPSSSRPPPPHPILKKSRGPSSSGPRPTARFASPPASGDEAIHDGDAVSTSTASITASEMPPPPLPLSVKQRQGNASASSSPASNLPEPSRGKKATVAPAADMPPPPVPPPTGERTTSAPGKKVVATTAASKRRPLMTRRPSSQSSLGLDSSQRVAGLGAASKRSTSKRSTSTASQAPGHASSSSQTSDSGLSAKAVGKRRANPGATKRSTSQSVPPQTAGQSDQAEAEQQSRPTSPQRRSTWDVRDSVAYHETVEGRSETLQQQQQPPPATSKTGAPPVAGFVADQAFEHGAPPMIRSRSNNSDRPQRLREPGGALLPSQPTSSVVTVTATARGQFDSETVTSKPAVPEARDIPDQVIYGSRPSTSMLDQQLKPTPPNPVPSIPFGRSKSELTLLLARGGKPRKGEEN
ncbi:hypothetical protein C7999DRAFT_15215 [Corynascus novoguineensis]|uniref:Uncharacterized protein n=1 Tax=Corynascus novoguineensis TaxID=1126955 RepID=A0AAN7CQY5_9PEZI|nr:hypothetical protein C7999DRAFT_15215 [Corynascus novoguineensis]